MKNSSRRNIFYLESLILVVVYAAVLAILSQAFTQGHLQSRLAREKTQAVCLAVNAAEAVSAADSPESLYRLLDENGNAELLDNDSGKTVRAAYHTDMKPASDGNIQLAVSWNPQQEKNGTLVRSTIRVSSKSSGVELYTLETAIYLRRSET